MSSSQSTMYLQKTYCRRYLSRFAGISDDTIDILVQNGFDSVHTLRAINIDKDWHILPPNISIGQKLLLRQALIKLPDITTDDDYDSDKQEMTPKLSTTKSRKLINLNDNMQTISDNNSNVDSVTSSDSEFALERLAFKRQPVVVLSPLKMPVNESNTVDNSRLNESEVKTKSTDRFKCGQCDRYFSTESWFEYHMNSCHLKCRPFRCDKCKNGFFNNISLLNHLAQKHVTKAFACDCCHFKSWSKWHITQHKLIHSANRPHVCNYKNCDKSFKRKDKLREHQLSIHSTDRQFVCNYDDCDQSFSRKQTLNRHQKDVHSTERPFVCNYDDCNQSFKRKDNMRKHQTAVHLNNRRDVCDDWDDSDDWFKNKETLSRHKKLIHRKLKHFK